MVLNVFHRKIRNDSAIQNVAASVNRANVAGCYCRSTDMLRPLYVHGDRDDGPIPFPLPHQVSLGILDERIMQQVTVVKRERQGLLVVLGFLLESIVPATGYRG